MSKSHSNPEICGVADTAAVWDEGARRFAAAARDAIAARGRFMVALSGGSTPEGLYRELATRHSPTAPDKQSAALSIPWSHTHIFFGDERYVPHDDPQSNFRLAREALLDHVPIPAKQIYPMPTNAADRAVAAAEYEKTLRQAFPTPLPSNENQPPIPRFDLILLGMGPDGHTASLFPGTKAVHEQHRLVVAPWVEKFQTYRLTLTPPVLCHGRQLLFLLSGAAKADTLRDVLEGPFDPSRLPSQIVRPVDGRLTWLIDREAAARLGD